MSSFESHLSEVCCSQASDETVHVTWDSRNQDARARVPLPCHTLINLIILLVTYVFFLYRVLIQPIAIV